jgi:hypothetical protein
VIPGNDEPFEEFMLGAGVSKNVAREGEVIDYSIDASVKGSIANIDDREVICTDRMEIE